MRPFIIAWILSTALPSGASEEDAEVILRMVETGVFVTTASTNDLGVRIGRGNWSIKASNGITYYRDRLDDQVDRLTRLGRSSFRPAFRRLDHPEPYVRYIAATTLNRISGIHAQWYTHAKPGDTINGESDWSEKAKQQWVIWHRSSAGGIYPEAE